MATQDELDEAVVQAAGTLSQTLSLLSAAQSQKTGHKAEMDRFQALLVEAREEVRVHREAVKNNAAALNAAITAAKAGPTP